VSSTTPKCSPLFLLQSISFFFITADTLANNLIVTFRAWDEFQSLDYKLNSVFDGLAFRTGYQGAKCLVQLSCSSHRLPRSLVTKELRITKNQEIECFVLNEEVRVDRTISSSEELLNFATDFFSSTSCFGVPFDSRFNNVKSMMKGHRNILNRWQSNLCAKKIEISGCSSCLSCNRLRKSLLVKVHRYTIVNRTYLLILVTTSFQWCYLDLIHYLLYHIYYPSGFGINFDIVLLFIHLVLKWSS